MLPVSTYRSTFNSTYRSTYAVENLVKIIPPHIIMEPHITMEPHIIMQLHTITMVDIGTTPIMMVLMVVCTITTAITGMPISK